VAEPFSEGQVRAPLLQLVNKVCDRFEAAWAAGGRPRLEDYLGGTLGWAQAALLPELLALELAYRRARGEAPTPEEYQARFPEHAPLVAAAFAEAPPAAPAAATPAQPRPGAARAPASSA
jgi:serine/threonine-protein kinase